MSNEHMCLADCLETCLDLTALFQGVLFEKTIARYLPAKVYGMQRVCLAY